MEPNKKIAGIILCGGQSRRMGISKAMLPFGDHTMLQRVMLILANVVEKIVVVAAQDQTLPKLPDGISEDMVTFVTDRQEGRGPMEGIAVGLSALGSDYDVAYITSCDVPLLSVEFIDYLLSKLDGNEIVVPFDDRYHYPLAALYRTSVLDRIESLIQQDRMRPVFLFDEAKTLRITTSELEKIDEQLHSLMNINEPDDYFSALHIANLEPSQEIAAQLSEPKQEN